MSLSRLLPFALAAALCLLPWRSADAAELEVVAVPGVTLKGNPLGDPAARRMAVFVPEHSSARTPLPLIIYLPGWGGSSEDAIAQGSHGWFSDAVDRLASDRLPVRLAVVDGRSRYGGSQFLNSSATGMYADYISRDILPLVKERYATGAERCIIAGHSSGAYGALMLAISEHSLFQAVVALSPDSDFETTHKPLVQQPSVRSVTKGDLNAAMEEKSRAMMPGDGLATLVLGLCANYTPDEAHPGRFEWLYDARGEWRPEVWQRWLDKDPLIVVRRNADAFAQSQRVYLDGAEHDEFGANIGARKIYEALRGRSAAATFFESPGHHSDRLAERLIRGVEWVQRPD